jgi:ParB-like chromosome segregation protein Spo0J
MSVLEIELDKISLEITGQASNDDGDAGTSVDCDFPLVVTRGEGGRYLLVDGLRRFLALRSERRERVWVILKTYTPIEARLARIRLNSPRRKLRLAEEIDLIERLAREDGLTPRAIARAVERKTSWVERRLTISSSVTVEAREIVPPHLVATSFLEELAEFPRSEQIAIVGALDLARPSLRDATRFLRLLSTQDSAERAISRRDPRAAMDRLRSLHGESSPASSNDRAAALHAVVRSFDSAIEKTTSLASRLLRPILLALLRRVQLALDELSSVADVPLSEEPVEHFHQLWIQEVHS